MHNGIDVSTGLLLTFVSVATYTDIRGRMIYNGTTYAGILAALVINAVGTVLESTRTDSEGLQKIVGWIGWIGLWQSAYGLLACGVLLLLCYVFFRLGGGDVELMAMVGAFVGPFAGIEIVLWTFVLGAALAILLLIWNVGAMRLLVGGFRRLGAAVRLRDVSQLVSPAGEDAGTDLFLAPSALAAIILVRFELIPKTM